MKTGIFILILCLFAWPLKAEDPWSVSVTSPVIHKKAKSKTSHTHSDGHTCKFCHPQTRGRPSSTGLNFYQKYISSFDGARCRMSPTCSGYASYSLKRYGAIMGLILTADRLMHEGDKQDMLKLQHNHEYLKDWQLGPSKFHWHNATRYFNLHLRFSDTHDDNTYWWNK